MGDGCFYDIMTTGLNTLDTAPLFMPILEHSWYGSTGTCPPSAFSANFCKTLRQISENFLGCAFGYKA